MQINKKADFVLKGDKIVYPPVRTDGLELYYDTKGKKNTDTYKNKLLDMSGNGQHGKLHNFNYKNLSGYQEDSELVFDGIEDKLVLGDVEKPEIISASKNLFNDYILSDRGNFQLGVYSASPVFQLKPNTVYTISAKEVKPSPDGYHLVLYVRDATNGAPLFSDPDYGSTHIQSIFNRRGAGLSSLSQTFTTPDSGMISFSYYDDRNGQSSEGNWFTDVMIEPQLEEGSTATPYVPYIPTAKMTYQLNNNIISYGEGETVKWVKDGEVVEVNGNMFSVYDFVRNNKENGYLTIEPILSDGGLAYSSFDISNNHLRPKYLQGAFEENTEYTLSFKLESIRDTHASADYAFYMQYTDGSNERISVRLRDQNKSRSFTSDGNKTIDFITTSRQYNGDVIVYQVKVEKGSQATQWIPNSMDLLEARELGGNILGDMEDIVDASPRDRQSGKEVFTEHADDSHVEVEVDGQSYQHAGKGGDLIKESDPIYAWVGTHNARSDTGAFFFTAAPYYPATYQIEARAVDDNLVGAEFGWQWRSTIRGETVTLSKEWKKASAYFEDGPISIGLRVIGGTGLIELRHIKAEEGPIATPYIPAPSPDYPIEIHSLNDFDVVSQKSEGGTIDGNEVGGRNLLQGSTSEPKTVSWQNWDYFFYNGDLSAINLSPGDEVVLRFYVENTDVEVIGFFQALNENYAFRQSSMQGPRVQPGESGYSTVSWVIPETIDGLPPKRLRVAIRNREGMHSQANVTYYLDKLEIGTVATDWTPAPEDITEDTNHPLINKINLSLSEPLRSAGDMKDRLFKDSDGLWKIERNVGEKVLDGSGSWTSTSSRTFYFQHSSIRNIVASKEGAISNKYKSGRKHSDWGIYQDTVIQNTDNGRLYFFTKKEYSTLDDWNNYLRSELDNNTPVVVHYGVASPIVETLNQELQDKLNNLRSFKDSNYIYTVQNTDNPHKEQLKPTLHATFNSKDYLKETRTLTNLLIWARELTDEELIHHNQLFLNRFNLPSGRVIGEPIEQTLNLLHGGMVGHSLEQNYTINI